MGLAGVFAREEEAEGAELLLFPAMAA